MASYAFLKKLVLSLPEVTEEAHFEKISFRVKKKIFVTSDDHQKIAVLKLSESDQDLFGLKDPTIIYPVQNKWGKQGWTIFHIEVVSISILQDALVKAYCRVAPKKFSDAAVQTFYKRK